MCIAIKEWNDSTSVKEIVALSAQSTARIVVVVREWHIWLSLAYSICTLSRDSVICRVPCSVRFANGAYVRFTIVRNVCACQLRGERLDAAYLVDSFAWSLIEQDTVRCEIAPLIGR